MAGAGDEVVRAEREGKPEGDESSGGDRAGRGLNHHVSQRIREWSKAPKAGGELLALTGNREQEARCNDKGATAGDEPVRLLARENP